jgi:hypothetical protein
MVEPVDTHSADRAVFVTDDDRRGRRLRRGAFVATTLACLWLIGLGVGMLGFDSLPGISLGPQREDNTSDRARRDSGPERPSPIARPFGLREPVVVSQGQNLQGASRSRGQALGQRAPTDPRPIPPVEPQTPQQPLNPTQRQRGWARTGLPAPPGQVRKAQPKPPPGSRGQRRGQTITAATTPPLPPGQAKKIPPPPPPEG